jgi:ketosteroid isomerase-like protein
LLAVAQDNVELVKRLLERFAETGEPAWDALDEAIEVHDHDILDAGDHRAHAGVGRWLEDWASAWSDYTMEPEEFLDAGERVVAFILQRATGQGSGVALERQDAIVFEVRDGKIARLDYYNNRDQALRAAGLAE